MTAWDWTSEPDRNAGVRIYESDHGVENGKIGTGAGSPVLSSKP
jgi:hypothetical protein